ncbi:MAG: pyridoxal-phosphate dependent enzyme, partial [Bacteroidetes bacterium]|nr:pyridoxal-phosphate dependent enzyme [Bacteroidota bacterium]
SIDAAAPRNLYLAADAVHKSGGYCIEVSDSEIMNAQQKLAREHGLLSEPASSASLAGLQKSVKLYPEINFENSLLMLTGNGLKDTASLEKWNNQPVVKSYTDWTEELT